MSKRPISGLDEHQKAFVKLIEANARRHRKHEVFRDFCEMAAISLSWVFRTNVTSDSGIVTSHSI